MSKNWKGGSTGATTCGIKRLAKNIGDCLGSFPGFIRIFLLLLAVNGRRKIDYSASEIELNEKTKRMNKGTEQ
jgi:hypothetical protein